MSKASTLSIQKRIDIALKLPAEVAARQLAAMHRAANSERTANKIAQAMLDADLAAFVTFRNGCFVPKG